MLRASLSGTSGWHAHCRPFTVTQMKVTWGSAALYIMLLQRYKHSSMTTTNPRRTIPVFMLYRCESHGLFDAGHF